jgi:hypothetical protein
VRDDDQSLTGSATVSSRVPRHLPPPGPQFAQPPRRAISMYLNIRGARNISRGRMMTTGSRNNTATGRNSASLRIMAAANSGESNSNPIILNIFLTFPQ